MRYEKLEKAYQEGRATMPVSSINHFEFVMKNKRYFVGWSSEGVDKIENFRKTRDVIGWIVYKVEVDYTCSKK